ncbi:ribonuclease HIII [Mycoplasma procyoni]|uniref:ribonuclease HIII n=1 Tax=Mycoplasma procyoni TaxID=568784 RepID=UPI00197BE4BA|nr:ribonuclease HIII [Mycoplasma procyoni]MBN3535070.1 ribonuclease HIII [Mycoplasma procyoni]
MKILLGCDETGVGDYFSPVIATALFIPENKKQLILENNLIRDSKRLSDDQIRKVAPFIKENTVFKTTILSQKNYNKLIQDLNANELKMLIHLMNINYLEKNHAVSEVIIDQFSTTNSIQKYIQKLLSSKLPLSKINSKLILETKAEDKYLEVACASIIARAELLDYMQKQREEWNFVFPLGVNNMVKQAAKEFIKQHGYENLVHVAKVHFKTTKEIIDNI